MTAHRRPAIPFSDAPRATCRWCGEPIVYEEGAKRGEPDRRRRWHPACVDAYNATDPREARRLVRKRDRGRCAECRLDTNALKRLLRGRGMAKKLRQRGFKPRKSLWELDHIVPLIDGGSHDLDNLQTLCTPCHKRKTAREAAERAARRHVARLDQPQDTSVQAAEGSALPACAGRPTGDAARPDSRPPEAIEALLERASLVNERVEAWLEDWRRAIR